MNAFCHYRPPQLRATAILFLAPQFSAIGVLAGRAAKRVVSIPNNALKDAGAADL
jgi:hypothetical protein